MLVGDQRGGGGKVKAVAVGRRPRSSLGTNHVLPAGFVVNHDGLAQRPGQALTSTLVKTDELVIDGAVRGIGRTTLGAGAVLRKTQTGFARSYAALILIGAVALIAAIWVVTQ